MISLTEIYVLIAVGVAGLAYIIGYEDGYRHGRGVEHQRWSGAPNYMRTPEGARAKLIDATRKWRAAMGVHMGTAKQLRELDIREREAKTQLAAAAALWLWHEENEGRAP